jgi:hypothetical protein
MPHITEMHRHGCWELAICDVSRRGTVIVYGLIRSGWNALCSEVGTAFVHHRHPGAI